MGLKAITLNKCTGTVEIHSVNICMGKMKGKNQLQKGDTKWGFFCIRASVWGIFSSPSFSKIGLYHSLSLSTVAFDVSLTFKLILEGWGELRSAGMFLGLNSLSFWCFYPCLDSSWGNFNKINQMSNQSKISRISIFPILSAICTLRSWPTHPAILSPNLIF